MQERERERERERVKEKEKKERKTAKGEGGQPGQREKEREEARGECMLGCADRDGAAACAHTGRRKEREPGPAPREENKRGGEEGREVKGGTRLSAKRGPDEKKIFRAAFRRTILNNKE